MDWSNLYGPDAQPDFESISSYVKNDLWQEFNSALQNTYHVLPKLAYSKCSMQPGWNVKYQKSGKSLCTLYPMDGYFIALVVIGNKEVNEAELLLPLCSEYTQDLYRNTALSLGGRWLMIHVASHSVFEDAIQFIKCRVKPKQ